MKKIKFLTNDTKPVFPSAENEQLEKLAESDVLRIYRENIKEIAKSPFCPRYHLVAPAGYLHDPNGLCFWRGKWHLFYQHVYGEDSAEGLSGSSICWGHAVSDDLIRWKDLPDAIYPGPDISCWSGATLVEEDRVIAAYYGLYSGIVVAVSSDPLLLNWEKYGTVIPERDEKGNPAKFPIYDPCIFKEGKNYYILSGGAEYDEKTKHNHRQTYLLRSEDLRNWEYRHPFIENDCYGGVGDDGSCPYFVDIGEKGRERKLYVHFSHISGSAYAVGDFDAGREKFTVLGGGKFSCGHWSGGGLHAPSCSPDGKGGAVVIFNMNAPAEGAFPVMSLPQTMKLAGPGNNEIYLDVAEGVRSLRGRHVSSDPRIIRAGQTFSRTVFPETAPRSAWKRKYRIKGRSRSTSSEPQTEKSLQGLRYSATEESRTRISRIRRSLKAGNIRSSRRTPPGSEGKTALPFPSVLRKSAWFPLKTAKASCLTSLSTNASLKCS
ncbi:MAG: glycoside hydrolase family 32 protein [Clostridia bacterium]|nr:glycoside hydrolase family 32 protein [Clostridia bacterium]